MTTYIASAAKWTADGLGRPFDTWELADDHLIMKIAKGIIMFFGKLFSLPFRALQIVLKDRNFTLAEGEGEMADIAEKITIATWNIQAFSSFIIERQNRPGVDHRLPGINAAVNDIDVDYLGFQEAHTRYVEEKIIEGQSSRFTRFQVDNNPKLIGFGSGLMGCDRLPENTRYEVYLLDDHCGGDDWVKKSFTVARVPGKMTIINTHLQSGRSQACSRMRESQIRQIITWARDHGEKVNILIGDLNVSRYRLHNPEGSQDEYLNSWLNPENSHVIDGFTEDERKQFTHAALNADGVVVSKSALDNIIAIKDEENGDAHCRLETKQVTPFENFDDPSDHALLVADIIFA